MKFYSVLLFFLCVLCPAPDEVHGEEGAQGQPVITLEDFYACFREKSQDLVEVQLGLMLAAASDGDEFYNLNKKISPECQRSVRASTKMYLNLATEDEVDAIHNEAVSKVFQTMKTTKELKHPLEFFCAEVDKKYEQRPNLAAIYVQLKESFSTDTIEGSRRKAYFNSIFKSDLELASSYSDFLKIPGFVKMTMQHEFSNQANASEAYNSTYNELAKAIIKVAKKVEFKERVEKVHEKVFSEVGTIIEKSSNVFENLLDDDKTLRFTVTMMDKFERYFNEDPDLRRELNSANKKKFDLINQQLLLLLLK